MVLILGGLQGYVSNVVGFDFQKLINDVFLSKQKLPIKLTLMGAWGVVSTQMPTISQERNS